MMSGEFPSRILRQAGQLRQGYKIIVTVRTLNQTNRCIQLAVFEEQRAGHLSASGFPSYILGTNIILLQHAVFIEEVASGAITINEIMDVVAIPCRQSVGVVLFYLIGVAINLKPATLHPVACPSVTPAGITVNVILAQIATDQDVILKGIGCSGT